MRLIAVAILFRLVFLRSCIGAFEDGLAAEPSCNPSCASGHGLCIENKCFCRAPWSGVDCSINTIAAVAQTQFQATIPAAETGHSLGQRALPVFETGFVLRRRPLAFMEKTASQRVLGSSATSLASSSMSNRSSGNGPRAPALLQGQKGTARSIERKVAKHYRSGRSGTSAGQLIRELFLENTRLRQEDARLKAEVAKDASDQATRSKLRRAFAKVSVSQTFVAVVGLACLVFFLSVGCACGLLSDGFSLMMVCSLVSMNCLMLKLLWLTGVFNSLANEFILYSAISIGLLCIVTLILLYVYHKRKQILLALTQEKTSAVRVVNQVVDVVKNVSAKQMKFPNRTSKCEATKLRVGEC